MATTYSNKSIVQDGLVFYVDAANPRSYVNSINNITSLPNNPITGSLENGVGFSNNAWDFDGIDDRIQFSDFVIPNNEFNCTVNVWANIETTSSSDYHGIYDALGGETNLRRRVRLLIQSDLTRSIYHIATGESQKIITNPTLNYQIWYNYTITKDTIVGSKYYINGNLIDSFSSDTTEIGAQGGSTWNGTVLGVGAENPTYFLNGKISNFSYYNKALTQQEVQQNYNALKDRFI